jgi:hypothetical protein
MARRKHRAVGELTRGWGRVHLTVGQRDILLLASRPQGIRKSDFMGANRSLQHDRIQSLYKRKALDRGLIIGSYTISKAGREMLTIRYDSARCSTCSIREACTKRTNDKWPKLEGQGCKDWEETY